MFLFAGICLYFILFWVVWNQISDLSVSTTVLSYLNHACIMRSHMLMPQLWLWQYASWDQWVIKFNTDTAVWEEEGGTTEEKIKLSSIPSNYSLPYEFIFTELVIYNVFWHLLVNKTLIKPNTCFKEVKIPVLHNGLQIAVTETGSSLKMIFLFKSFEG